MNYHQSMPLRERAMETLKESTTMLKVARNLLEQGNREEAARLQREARAKRDASVLLMTKANELEQTPEDKKRFQSHELRGFRRN
jgi:hypothetical protein